MQLEESSDLFQEVVRGAGKLCEVRGKPLFKRPPEDLRLTLPVFAKTGNAFLGPSEARKSQRCPSQVVWGTTSQGQMLAPTSGLNYLWFSASLGILRTYPCRFQIGLYNIRNNNFM